ncbi:MAG: alpha/beta fold hydrolase [Sphingobium sp.]
MTETFRSTRRAALALAGFVAAGGVAPALTAAGKAARPRERFLAGRDPSLIGPPPPQAPAAKGYFAVPGGRLWYWDTGGSGTPVVLMHPMTGSAQSWVYQQPALAKAGHRVLAFSRRGAFGSQVDPKVKEASPGDDLVLFADALKLSRFHLVGAAAGAFAAIRYAQGHQERLLSLTLAGSLLGLSEPVHVARSKALMPPQFQQLPAAFRELSPSYRVGNPEGVKRWLQIEESALSAKVDKAEPAIQAKAAAAATPGPTYADLRRIEVPTHLIFGDADLYSPPSLARPLLDIFPNARLSVIGEAGHATFWEQPEAFNAALLPLD